MQVPWTRQPPGTANPGVAWDSPLTRGLVGLAVPHLQRELVTGNLGVATTNFAPNTTNPFGLGGRTSEAVNTRLAFAGGWSKVSWPLTLVVVYRLRGTPTASNRIAGNWAANSYGYEITPSTTNFRAFISRSGAGITLTGNAVNTQLQVDILTIDATNGAYYQKGALVAGPSAHGGMVTPTGSFTFGSSNDGDSSHSAEYHLAALYNRILSPAEIAQISANPWQIFRPIVVPAKAPAGGGADYPVTQTEAATGSDTTSCLIGYAPAATEAGSASDAASAAMAAVVAIIEAASAADTVNGTASGDYTATITEAAGASSLEAAVSNYLAAISESASASDSASASLPGEYSVSISEAASAIETVVCAMSALVAINEAAAAADAANWVGAITYTRAPRGGGYPGTRPTTARGGQTNTARPAMTNTRR